MIQLSRIHHLGYACNDIESAINQLKKLYPVKNISPIIHDDYQDADLCLLTLESGPAIELVKGPTVEKYLEHGVSLYHTCYEVDDLEQAIDTICQHDGWLVKPAHAAPLFSGRRVAFLQTELGLIELLEANAVQHGFINLAGSFNTDHIASDLQEKLSQLQMPFNFQAQPYNQVLNALYDRSSLFYQRVTDVNVLCLRLEDCLRFQTVSNLESTLDTYIEALLTAVEQYCSQGLQLLICMCPQTITLSSQEQNILESKCRHLIESLQHISGVICDTQLLNHHDDIADPISDESGHLPYTEAFNLKVASHLCRLAHNIVRDPYKVIVVDCDNTLWDGVCGEVNHHELTLNAAHIRLQQTLKNLNEHGVLICICSKNNEEDVIEVFENKSMPLSLDDITIKMINWSSKAENIAHIAKSLNLSLSDFVFIDDNPMEIADIKAHHPDLLCLQFPHTEDKALKLLDNAWCLDKSLTKTLSSRKDFYQQNFKRESSRDASATYQEFLDTLNLNVDAHATTEQEYSRVAELTQRTHQFNLSNKNFNANQVKAWCDEGNLALSLQVSDRFGDYGLVGVLLAHLEQSCLIVDVFLLSCRILGKGVEYKMLRELAILAETHHCQQIELRYQPTAKNKPAHDFLSQLPYQQPYRFNVEDLKQIKYEVKPFESTSINEISSNRQIDNRILYAALNPSLSAQPTTVKGIQEIWQALLKKPVQLHDNFFELGGDSLLGVRLISRLHKEYGIKLSLSLIFEYPVLADMIDYLDALSGEYFQGIKPYHQPECISQSQKWFFLIDRYNGGNSWFYNLPYTIKMTGALDEKALDKAFIDLLKRHHVLRAYFRFDEQIYQDYHSLPDTCLSTINVSEDKIEQVLKEHAKRAFDLCQDLLFRVTLFKTSSAYYLQMVAHHSIADGWSFGIIYNELSEFYHAQLTQQEADLTPLKIQYADYACWESEMLEHSNQLAYWQAQLKDLPPMQFPTDHTRQGPRRYEGKYVQFELSPQLSEQLNRMAAERNLSLFMLLLLIYARSVARLCQQSDIAILVPVSGRRHHDIENLVGCFTNNIIMRLAIDDEANNDELLERNRQVMIDGLKHQDIPLPTVLEKLALSSEQLSSSLFQIMFSMQNTQNRLLRLDNMSCENYMRGFDTARFDLVLECEEVHDRIIAGFYYDTELFEATTIKYYIDMFQADCESMASTVLA